MGICLPAAAAVVLPQPAIADSKEFVQASTGHGSSNWGSVFAAGRVQHAGAATAWVATISLPARMEHGIK